jgi:hypothetical protein
LASKFQIFRKLVVSASLTDIFAGWDNFAGLIQIIFNTMRLNGPIVARRGRGKEESMSLFVVRFMKDVLGGNGREIEICQSSLEVDASSEGHATELAKKKFCETEALRDWSLHADRIQVRQADCPS